MSSTIQHIQRRPTTAADEAFLQQLYSSTRAAEMALVNWDDTQKEQFLRTQFNAQTNQYWETYPQSQYDIIEADGVAVGRIWTNQSDTELRILDITIAPHHRDKGIGSHIMRDLIAIGEAAALSIRFYVWQDNEPAQRFYQRHHFRAVRQDGAYILMER